VLHLPVHTAKDHCGRRLSITLGKYDSHKDSVLESSRWLLENGYFGSRRGSGGNVSVRIDEGDLMAITPSSVPYRELSAEDIYVVDFDLSIIEGGLKPSVEAGMHSIIYKMRPDVHAIVHTHQVFGSVFGVINEPIPALFDEIAFSLGHIVEVVPYALSGSVDLVNNVRSKLSNNANAYILQNHGVLALGKDLDKALLHAELLEKAAQVYFMALSTDKVVHTLPEPVIEMIRVLRNHEVSEALKK
jgi:ribulose-5-phosphate 4-epimerase/fuculose-1-phosphate aldolase